MQIKFAHEVGAVSLGGFHAQAQSDGDLFGGFSFSDQLDHFTLSWGQDAMLGIVVYLGRTEIAVEHHLRDFGSEEGSAVLQGLYGCDEVPTCVRFEQEASSSGSQN